MSSELHKYIETAIEKKQNLFNAEVLNFPNDINKENTKKFSKRKLNFWNISDKSNIDQLRAVTGVCFMFVALVVMGVYSSFN